MKKIVGLGLLLILISFAYSAEKVYSTTRAYVPEEASQMKSANVVGPATVYYDGVFHQFYCSTGGGNEDFFVHADDFKFDKRDGNTKKHGFFCSQGNCEGVNDTWDFIRYRTSKNGSLWSGPRIVMTQTRYSSSQKENTACDPAIIQGYDGYWYLYYTGNIDNYNTVVYVSRSKTIGGPYLKLTKRIDKNGENIWERWPDDPKPILQKWTGNKYTDNTIYGVGQLSVVKHDGKYHFWYADNSETDTHKMRIRYLESDSPINIPYKKAKNISIKGRTDSNKKLDVIDFGDVRWNPKTKKYEMWLLSRWNDDLKGEMWNETIDLHAPQGSPYNAANEKKARSIAESIRDSSGQLFFKYTSENGLDWKREEKVTFGGPYFDVHNLGVSGDENGAILENRYILSFAGPLAGIKKLADDFYLRATNGNVLRCNKDGTLNAKAKEPCYYSSSYPWVMYQMTVGGLQTSYVKISYKQQFPNQKEVKSDKLEYITGDFDGDGVTDLAAVDRKTSQWYILSSQSGKKGIENIPWGWPWDGMTSSHTIVTGDYDGDGKTDRAIVNRSKGKWTVISSKTGKFMHSPSNNSEVWHNWKWSGMDSRHVVVAGDYDGDGKTDRAIVDTTNGKWYIISSRTGQALEPDSSISLKTPNNKKIWGWKFPNWSQENSRILVGDYDRDGVTDIGMVNVSTKKWFIYSSQTGAAQKNLNSGKSLWGWDEQTGLSSESIITTGDYNGDGVADRGYVDWAQGVWFTTCFNRYNPIDFVWKSMQDDMKKVSRYKVLEGDYDGDGATDHAFVDLNTQRVYIYSSEQNGRGINTAIKHVYPFSTAEYIWNDGLKKKMIDEKDDDSNIPTLANVGRVSIDGSKLIIKNANNGDKVTVMDLQGKIVTKSAIIGNSATMQLQSTGVYIVRVGSLNHKVFVK